MNIATPADRPGQCWRDAALLALALLAVHALTLGVHRELWVPAEELEEFNQHIIGPIEVTQRFT